MVIVERLREYAAQLGLLIGWARPVTDERVAGLLQARMTSGKYPPFVNYSLTERVNPRLQLRDVKTVISVAVPYVTEYFPKPADRPRGQLARFSWGKDYHGVVKRKLEQLADFLQKELGAKSFACSVDTGPLVDKHWARQAGLGWYGKNTTILTERYGSWVVLGELLVDVELGDNGQELVMQETCRGCDRCIRACPTGAIEAPYVVNPYKCLSYLTQEKGIFPRRYRDYLGDRIYGCDICQEACPHNQNVDAGRVGEFLISRQEPDLAYPGIDLLLGLSNKEFREIFGQSTCGWRGKIVLQRNALLAAGNMGYVSEQIYRLAENSQSKVLRLHALWSLYKSQGKRVRDYFARRLSRELDPEIRSELTWCLNRM